MIKRRGRERETKYKYQLKSILICELHDCLPERIQANLLETYGLSVSNAACKNLGSRQPVLRMSKKLKKMKN